MAAARGRGLRPGGVVRALGRLVVLVAVGFGLGLLFGVVTEEPDLLAGHLTGEGESVVLDGPSAQPGATTEDLDPESPLASERSDRSESSRPPQPVAALPVSRAGSGSEPAADLPKVAAAPRAASATRSPAADSAPAVNPGRAAAVPVARRTAAPESARRAQGAQASGGGERSWSIQVGAFSEQAAADRLADALRGRYPVEVLPADAKAGRWRVRVQPIRDEATAQEMAAALKRDERLPTWVTPMEGRAGR